MSLVSQRANRGRQAHAKQAKDRQAPVKRKRCNQEDGDDATGQGSVCNGLCVCSSKLHAYQSGRPGDPLRSGQVASQDRRCSIAARTNNTYSDNSSQ